MANNKEKREKMPSKIEKKFYLHTWFICGIFACMYFHWIFAIPGVILVILQFFIFRPYLEKYGTCEKLDKKMSDLEIDLDTKHKERIQRLENHFKEDKARLQITLAELSAQCKKAEEELSYLQSEILSEYYKLSDYDGLSSEDCKNKLALLKNEEQSLIKSGDAILIKTSGPRKTINDNIKQILRCFNAECDNILMGISVKNIDTMRNKITKSYDTLNKIFLVDGISLHERLLEIKLNELNLVYTYEIKHEQERELQRAIKEQMLEEEKVRREIEAQKAKIEKDQIQCSKEINKLMAYMQKTQNDIEKQLYIDKIRELEEKLKELEVSKENVLAREVNARAGYVYVISNIGSFGEDIYKIGMTRRLEPMDRIKELSSASVPFAFDVHAMIFSDDAPALETTLHQHFDKQRINKVNPRKEFFRVSLDEIEQVVKDNFNNTTEFTRIPVATEYRQSLNFVSA